jgi:hypothetical protein
VPDFQNTNNLILCGGTGLTTRGVLGAKETKSLLEKLDDGSPDTGLVRACEFDDTEDGNCDEATPESLSEVDSTKVYGLISKLDF